MMCPSNGINIPAGSFVVIRTSRINSGYICPAIYLGLDPKNNSIMRFITSVKSHNTYLPLEQRLSIAATKTAEVLKLDWEHHQLNLNTCLRDLQEHILRGETEIDLDYIVKSHEITNP